MHRVATMAETYDVALAPHCPLGPIALAACMQVAASAPNCKFPSLSLFFFLVFYASIVVIQEMSWQVRVYKTLLWRQLTGVFQIHYNTETTDSELSADLHTYVNSPEVFDILEGYIPVLQGVLYMIWLTLGR